MGFEDNVSGLVPNVSPSYPVKDPTGDYTNKVSLDFEPFNDDLRKLSDIRVGEIERLILSPEKTITEIQSHMAQGELTCEELSLFYLHRIRKYDVNIFNSVLYLNPSALHEAQEADRRRTQLSSRELPPLNGVPILIKGNVAIKGVPTTAGAAVLKDWIPERDAFFVSQLRKAGAVVLGAANLCEWANYMDPTMPIGYSTLGGCVRNAYGLFDPSGSSTGSGVSGSANFCAIAIGSETCGSITQPSKQNSLVGLKVSKGVVSGDHIVPLVSWLDVAGPMGRCVKDVAKTLSAMTGVDENDRDTERARELVGVDFEKFCTLLGDAETLTVGMPKYDLAETRAELEALEKTTPTTAESTKSEADEDASATVDYTGGDGDKNDEKEESVEDKKEKLQKKLEDMTAENEALESAANVLRNGGVKIVEFDAALITKVALDLGTLLEFGFQDSFAQFAERIRDSEPSFPINTLKDVVKYNEQNPNNHAHYGMKYVSDSANTQYTTEAHDEAKAKLIAEATEANDAIYRETGADVLLINDVSQILNFLEQPGICIPAGYKESGEPVGVILSAPYLGEPQLLRTAYIFEHHNPHKRVLPDLDTTTKLIKDGLAEGL